MQALVARVGGTMERWAHRFVPDPFVFAVVLTAATLLAGMLGQDRSLSEMAGYWYGGFFELLTFGMQMTLILVTGHALATSPPIRWTIHTLGGLPRSGPTAAAFVALLSMGAALVNWGFGLIVGALLARAVARSLEDRGVRAHYPLLGAAGYMGLLVWHGGVSGSAPLKVAEEGIPLQATLGSGMNVSVNAALLVVVPWLLFLLHPRGPECLGVNEVAPPAEKKPPPEDRSALPFAARLERSRILLFLVVAFGTAGFASHATREGFSLYRFALNDMIFVFLLLGLLLHGSLRSYRLQAVEGARASSGIILQFPFYAGITGMMLESGLVAEISDFFARVSSETTYPLYTFLSAGVVNLFVPSGGGQWAVQGPIAVEAAHKVGVPLSKTVMAVSYGDEWTNMLQPFWALALLGITGLRARHIIGYTVLVMVVAGVMFGTALLVF